MHLQIGSAVGCRNIAKNIKCSPVCYLAVRATAFHLLPDSLPVCTATAPCGHPLFPRPLPSVQHLWITDEICYDDAYLISEVSAMYILRLWILCVHVVGTRKSLNSYSNLQTFSNPRKSTPKQNGGRSITKSRDQFVSKRCDRWRHPLGGVIMSFIEESMSIQYFIEKGHAPVVTLIIYILCVLLGTYFLVTSQIKLGQVLIDLWENTQSLRPNEWVEHPFSIDWGIRTQSGRVRPLTLKVILVGS